MMASLIVGFHRYFYIAQIQKLSFNLLHVRILGTYHYVKKRWEAITRRSAFQDVLCPRDYSEHILASSTHQIKS